MICKCGSEIIEKEKFYECSGCGKTVWKEFFGRKFKESEVNYLFQGLTIYVDGLISRKTNKKFSSGVKLDENSNLQLVFDENEIKEAVNTDKYSCGGVIKESKKTYFCSSCGAFVYKQMYSKNIGKDLAVKVLQGEKQLIKDFKSKAGKTFEAFLFINEQKKPQIEFPVRR